MTIPAAIRTTRLALIAATPELARAELNDAAAFARELGAAVPADWPPNELADARPVFLCLMEANPAWIGWLGWYAIELDPAGDGIRIPNPPPDSETRALPELAPPRPPTLIGSVGFKGPPDQGGVVEIGYSILPAHMGRGLATEMTAAAIAWAARRGARHVQAHVDPANRASIRVLEKLRFREAGPGGEPGMVLYAREIGSPDFAPSSTARSTKAAVPGSPAGGLKVEALHREADERVRALETLHPDRLHCRRGCRFCCIDEITVFEIEAEPIRAHYASLLATGTPHPAGGCACLDSSGGCRIYEHRPYVCRTQGLPLRWEDDGPDGEPAEYRDICPLNAAGPEVLELPADACWEIGPFEARLAALQAERDESRVRIRLRDLFAARAPESRSPGQA